MYQTEGERAHREVTYNDDGSFRSEAFMPLTAPTQRVQVNITIHVALLVDSPRRRAHGNAASRLALGLVETAESR